jgi:hypothetical protein
MISSVGPARMVKLDSRGPLLPPRVIYEVTPKMGQFRTLRRCQPRIADSAMMRAYFVEPRA